MKIDVTLGVDQNIIISPKFPANNTICIMSSSHISRSCKSSQNSIMVSFHGTYGGQSRRKPSSLTQTLVLLGASNCKDASTSISQWTTLYPVDPEESTCHNQQP